MPMTIHIFYHIYLVYLIHIYIILYHSISFYIYVIMLYLDFWSWMDFPLGNSAVKLDPGGAKMASESSECRPSNRNSPFLIPLEFASWLRNFGATVGRLTRFTGWRPSGPWDRCFRSWRISFLEWPNSFRCKNRRSPCWCSVGFSPDWRVKSN